MIGFKKPDSSARAIHQNSEMSKGGCGDPIGGLAQAALVAGGAEVAAFASEGEEAFVTAVGAVEAEEAGDEVAAAIAGQGFEPTPSVTACGYCDFRIACPAAEL